MGKAITDIRAFSVLETDGFPRFIVRDENNRIFLTNDPITSPAILVTSLNGTSQGACLIPFRPNESPQSWMYCAAAEDYKKVCASDPTTINHTANVGIAEPPDPPEAAPGAFSYAGVSIDAGDWAEGGVAGAPANSDRTSDTMGVLIADPVDPFRWSIQVSNDKYYQVFQQVDLGDEASDAIIQDVIPPVNQGAAITIESIYYFVGSTGRCIIVPSVYPVGPTIPIDVGPTPAADSFYPDAILAYLRRGALIQLDNGVDDPEIVFVLNVVRGPNGIISFETSTAATYAATNTITGIPTIVVWDNVIDSTFAGQPIVSVEVDSSFGGVGVGTLDQTPLSFNPFTQIGLQPDDYIVFGVKIADLTKFVMGRIIFNVGVSVDYTTDAYYADFTQNDILNSNPSVAHALRTPTFNDFLVQQGISTEIFNSFGATDVRRVQLQTAYNALYGNASSPSQVTQFYPSDQWTVIQFPIRALTRAGQNQSLSLTDCNGIRMEFQVTDAVDISFSEIMVGGEGQPDVGLYNSPYFYAYRGRSSLTGALSNPSPMSRYGVSPRRQQVTVQINSVSAPRRDSQVDLIDIFRFGGTLTSWRYVGTAAIGSGDNPPFLFTDDYFDTTIAENPPLDYDNFQPWPTIDVPFDSGLVDYGTFTAYGSVIIISFLNSSLVPGNLLRWLPGTLSLINSVGYTLWTRPVKIDDTTYRLQFTETIGQGVIDRFVVYEPNIANQFLPYVWGPDEYGTVFGTGDPLRPGFVYFAKSNNPDSAPDQFNLELTPPSEPMLGGVIIDGLCVSASSHRWWALYPNFGGVPRYQKVQRAIPCGLAAPYAYCTDGKRFWFVAWDGVWEADSNTGKSITDGPLRDIFPHEGVDGRDVIYAGITIHHPDYRYAAQFRLSFAKGYVYFDYVDSNQDRRTLILDTIKRKAAWSIDDYANPITCHYLIEGQEDDLTTPGTAYPKLLMGDANGNILLQKDRTNDAGIPISGLISTFEFNGGDVRADMLWGDAFLDSIPESQLTVTPISDRIASGASTTVPAAIVRTRVPIKASGIEKKTLGILVQWTDDFDVITDPTKLFAWQPLHQPIPISIYQWKTQRTSFGMQGYFHIGWILAAYKSTAIVTLHFDIYDGTAPSDITLPSTGGVEKKILFPLTFNKMMLVGITGTSSAPWQPFFDAWEVYVGQWSRQAGYQIFTDVEQPRGIARTIAAPVVHSV